MSVEGFEPIDNSIKSRVLCQTELHTQNKKISNRTEYHCFQYSYRFYERRVISEYKTLEIGLKSIYNFNQFKYQIPKRYLNHYLLILKSIIFLFFKNLLKINETVIKIMKYIKLSKYQ